MTGVVPETERPVMSASTVEALLIQPNATVAVAVAFRLMVATAPEVVDWPYMMAGVMASEPPPEMSVPEASARLVSARRAEEPALMVGLRATTLMSKKTVPVTVVLATAGVVGAGMAAEVDVLVGVDVGAGVELGVVPNGVPEGAGGATEPGVHV